MLQVYKFTIPASKTGLLQLSRQYLLTLCFLLQHTHESLVLFKCFWVPVAALHAPLQAIDQTSAQCSGPCTVASGSVCPKITKTTCQDSADKTVDDKGGDATRN